MVILDNKDVFQNNLLGIYYFDNHILVRKSVQSDITALKDKLRKTDIDEIWASNHVTPKQALEESFHKSAVCLTIVNVDNSEIVAMFGINPETFLGTNAVIWMLASDGLDRIKIRVAKYSRKFIEFFLSLYPYLHNFVDVRNKKSIEWLKFCKATFEDPVNYGHENLLFRHFYFTRRQ